VAGTGGLMVSFHGKESQGYKLAVVRFQLAVNRSFTGGLTPSARRGEEISNLRFEISNY